MIPDRPLSVLPRMPIPAVDLPTVFDVVNAGVAGLAFVAACVAIRQTRRQSRFDRKVSYQARVAVVLGKRSAVVGCAIRQAGEMGAVLRDIDECVGIATPEIKEELEGLRRQVAEQLASVEGINRNHEEVVELASPVFTASAEPSDSDFGWLAKVEARTDLLVRQSEALGERILSSIAAIKASLARTRSNLQRHAR